MNCRELKDGKYLLTLNIEEGNIVCINNNKVAYKQGKEYILTVKDGIYYTYDDAHEDEQISKNFDLLEYFNVKKL